MPERQEQTAAGADLLLDVGNTSLRWALLQDGRLGEVRSVRHHGGLPIDLHAAWDLIAPPQRIFVANVAGEPMLAALRRVCETRWGRRPSTILTEARAFGVSNAYAEPAYLGVDRWLALLAAHRHFPGDKLIVDAGTAITFDLLEASGQHLGGLILPGIEAMRDRLLGGTHIPRVEPTDIVGVPWAADTATAIGAGTLQAPAALAERLHRQLRERPGAAPACQLLLTGGDAQRLRPVLPSVTQTVPELVLQGLALRAERD